MSAEQDEWESTCYRKGVCVDVEWYETDAVGCDAVWKRKQQRLIRVEGNAIGVA